LCRFKDGPLRCRVIGTPTASLGNVARGINIFVGPSRVLQTGVGVPAPAALGRLAIFILRRRTTPARARMCEKEHQCVRAISLPHSHIDNSIRPRAAYRSSPPLSRPALTPARARFFRSTCPPRLRHAAHRHRVPTRSSAPRLVSEPHTCACRYRRHPPSLPRAMPPELDRHWAHHRFRFTTKDLPSGGHVSCNRQ
jgi:hypothetical protein